MMLVSAKIDYACQAVLALSLQHESDQPLSMKSLAQAHDIPAQFLAQIFQQLRAAGIVKSTRGATGGYRLSRSPNRITAWDIVSLFEPPGNVPDQPANPLACAVGTLWKQTQQQRRASLEATTFADLARTVTVDRQPMYYI